MNAKQYKTITLFITMALAVIVSSFVLRKNYIIPLMAVVVSALLLLYLRGRVKEVIADERDYEMGGKAARLAIQIFSWIAALIMIVLYTQRDYNPSFEPIALILAYSVCSLMILYSLIFYFYDKIKYLKNKSIYMAIGIICLILFAMASMRFFSGEDDWICTNGQWIQHGNPSFPAPTAVCNP